MRVHGRFRAQAMNPNDDDHDDHDDIFAEVQSEGKGPAIEPQALVVIEDDDDAEICVNGWRKTTNGSGRPTQP